MKIKHTNICPTTNISYVSFSWVAMTHKSILTQKFYARKILCKNFPKYDMLPCLHTNKIHVSVWESSGHAPPSQRRFLKFSLSVIASDRFFEMGPLYRQTLRVSGMLATIFFLRLRLAEITCYCTPSQILRIARGAGY